MIAPEFASFELPGGAPFCIHLYYVPGCIPCKARNSYAMTDAEQAEWDRTRSSDVPVTAPQHLPMPNDRPAIADLVKADLDDRKRHGTEKYGTPLQAFNGRDPLVDAYQESLDQTQYLRQAIDERAALVAAARAVTADEDTIRDDVQGLCVFCQAGWDHSTTPSVHRNLHADDCPFARLRALVATTA